MCEIVSRRKLVDCAGDGSILFVSHSILSSRGLPAKPNNPSTATPPYPSAPGWAEKRVELGSQNSHSKCDCPNQTAPGARGSCWPPELMTRLGKPVTAHGKWEAAH